MRQEQTANIRDLPGKNPLDDVELLRHGKLPKLQDLPGMKKEISPETMLVRDEKEKKDKELTADEAKKILENEKVAGLLSPYIGKKGEKDAYTMRYDNLKEAVKSKDAFDRLLHNAMAARMSENKIEGKAGAVIRALEQEAEENGTTLYNIFKANALYQLDGKDGPKEKFVSPKEALKIANDERAKPQAKQRDFVIVSMEQEPYGKPPEPTKIK